MENRSDNVLMSEIQAGDLSKMGVLYERHKSALFSYFYRNTNNQMVSEDLVQNTFIKLIHSRDQFKGTGEFTYWMFHIARNTWIDNYRKKDPLNKSSDLDSTHIQEEWTVDDSGDEKQEHQRQLRYALQQISEEKREAIILSTYNGLTYKTIAQLSDCSENAIKSRVQRGILEIRDVLQKLKKS